ncbi:spore protease YyaC [Alteribacillus sp. HJP-4]|uniref:spore protease YyaC n=1 Tax=Alteribacillus sp. HJP-4 TaxID=2775394 RepID=UPI0035CCCD20
MLGKKPITERPAFSARIHADQHRSYLKLASSLKELIQTIPVSRDIVIVCIGTDRSTGDSLGPLTGTMLQKARLKRVHVHGTLAAPVHAVNLEETLADIVQKYRNPFLIAVDACLGRLKNVGTISLAEGPVMPGAAMNKKLPPVGDVHITGIVNVSGMMEYFVLQNTRLHMVMTIAECISEGFIHADRQLSLRQSPPSVTTLPKTYLTSKDVSKKEPVRP